MAAAKKKRAKKTAKPKRRRARTMLIDTHVMAWEFAFEHAASLESLRLYADGSAWLELEGNRDAPPPGPCEVYVPQLPEKLAWINSELDAAGWPPMSEWWTKRLARFYFGNRIMRERLLSPRKQRRACVWRVGRRGGKSTTICRVAVYECVFGDHDVPPGDTGVYAIISAERPQAKERVVTIKAICDVIGVEGKPMAESYEFAKMNRAIRCFTASITSVVSFTCIGAMCDEMAIWRDEKEGTNPAADIIRSLKPTTATMRNAVIHYVSAPWSTLDEHHKMYEAGNTNAQLVFYAPTWVANDNFISEEETHLLEPDGPSWARAYKAVPLASDETKFFSAALIDQAVKFDQDWSDVDPEIEETS